MIVDNVSEFLAFMYVSKIDYENFKVKVKTRDDIMKIIRDNDAVVSYGVR